jgi:hypothetical protein
MRWHDGPPPRRDEPRRPVRSGAVRRLSPAAAVLCSLLVLHVGSAAAYFPTTGSGSGATRATSILGPSGVSATQAGASVTVTWSAATLSSGAAVQGYTVTRSDGTSVCGSPALVTSLACTDSSPPSGTYTYTVDAVYSSWDQSATSAPLTILTAPTLSSEPANPSNNASAGFSFSAGNASAYQCKLDTGAYASCTSPYTPASLAQGSHTFSVRGISGSSAGPAISYTWTLDTIAPTQSIALAAGATGAYLSGTTLYYRGVAAGSFRLIDTVADGGSGPASATYPAINTTGWTHANETVSTPSGGPYSSSAFSWNASPGTPAGYSVTAADLVGNTTFTGLTFVLDNTTPTGGALTVNGTAASAGGSTSQATNSTSFTIGARTDYTAGGSGLRSSVLTVQSEALSGTGGCGAPGSGGPFVAATTIAGTTQPTGMLAGYCYVYTLTGTDNVGNTASISTTVVDNAVSFTVTSQPSSASAGTAASVTLTAIKDGVTDTTYTGAALSWSGASVSPTGTAPTLPTSPVWSAGVARFTITLVDAQTATLTVTDGTRSATFSPITVSPGTVSNVAWTSPSSSVTPLPSPCFFTCTYAGGFGNGSTWSANVSITDSQGNVVSNVGSGVTVQVSLAGGPGKGSATPATVSIPAAGAATSTVQVQYTSVLHGSYNDTLTAAATGLPPADTVTNATAGFAR